MGIYKNMDVRDTKGRRIRRCIDGGRATVPFMGKKQNVEVAREKHLGIFETNPTPFAKYATTWLERKKATIARTTYRDYLSILLKYVIPYLGGIPLCRVAYRDIEDFLDQLGSISAKRKNNIMVLVKSLFNDARRRGDISESPAELIRRLKEKKPFVDPFSFPEMKKFLAHVDPYYIPYFTTAFFTGMRPNEMFALKWIHVDFKMRTITVREGRVQGVEGPPKTLSSNRDIDILDPLYEVLCQHQLIAMRDSVHVFTNKNGRPLEVNNLRNKVWYPAMKKAGLRKRTMYLTRHTFASLMLSNGEDPLWVARMLGHTSLDMIFKHYGKFIRNRTHKDGRRFLEGLKESEEEMVFAKTEPD